MRPRYHPLDWSVDAERLARLDLSFATDVVYDVAAGLDGFALVARAVAPPHRKTYAVDWAGLRAAATALVAEDAGRLLGVAAMTVHAWNRRAVITDLDVDRAARGQGVGAGLLAALRTPDAPVPARAS